MTAMLHDHHLDFSHAHGDIACADAEALLTELTNENHDLHARLAHAEEAATADRLEADRLRALVASMNQKMDHLADEAERWRTQAVIAFEELESAEEVTLPEGTLTYAALTRADITTLYRSASRITRGPLPPAIPAAVAAAQADISKVMLEAGRAATDRIIRREVRRRRNSR